MLLKLDLAQIKLLNVHMDSFEVLAEKTDDDSIRLIHAVGVPRSMSTAFCRALNEMDTPSIYVNEPINRDNADVEKVAEHILQACRAVNANPDSTVTVITKNMASYTSDEAYKSLEGIASGTIWHIRNPLIQLGSLLTRIVNDLYVGQGENKIKQEDIYPFLDEACEYLIDGPKSQGYSKTGWASLEKHFLARDSSPQCVVDGSRFTEQPANVLALICSELDIVFSKNMTAGWKNGFINVINQGFQHETERSAWTSAATNSTSVMPDTRAPIDITKVPESLAEHIEKVALPAYQRITNKA